MIGLYAKALAALLGGIATWGVTASEDGISAPEWFGLVGVIGTAVAVFAIPNTVDDPEAVEDEGAGELRLILCIAAGILLVWLLFAWLGDPR